MSKPRTHKLAVLGRGHEFASGAPYPPTGASRRDLLKYAAVTAAIAGVTGAGGCTRQPREKIVPRVQMPEETVPGRPLYFATTHTHDGYARGAVAETHDGRPTKLDGNPDHPASLGAGDVWMQSAVWSLYDPDRLRTPMRRSAVTDWSNFGIWLRQQPAEGVRLLTGRVTSPTVARLVGELREKRPDLRWHRWSPVNDDNERAGTAAAFGRPLVPVYDLSKARVIVSLDADFLLGGPASLAHARQWAGRRGDNRLWIAETTPTLTGAAADELVRVTPNEVERVALRLWSGFRNGDASERSNRHAAASKSQELARWVDGLVADLTRSPGASVVLVGTQASPATHEAVARLNHALGNVGKTVTYIDPSESEAIDHAASLRELVDDMNAGRVTMLVVADCDPAATAPADLDFLAALKKVPSRVSLTSYDDATAAACEWRLPLSHELEAWGDGRAYDGTAAVCQPTVLPLHASRSLVELLALMLDPTTPTAGYDLVRATWKMDDATWQATLKRGLVEGSAFAPQQVNPAAEAASPSTLAVEATTGATTLVIRPDPCLWDGSYARNAWLRELPQPLTKLSWASAVLVSPNDAKTLGVVNDGAGNGVQCSVVKLTAGGRSAEAPAFVLDGQPDGTLTLHLGDAAYKLRTTDSPWQMPVTLSLTGDTLGLACTQRDFMQREHDRVIVKVAGHAGDEGESPRVTPDTLYPLWNYDDRIPQQNKWGMAIDTSACIGCNACVVACQSENNIPTVGLEQVARGREMQWIRVDRYRDQETGRDVFQPMMCQHCENAPCEVVCPVNATVHDIEGLNVQVYNRCVGTRYCSNNCPYKVRHFNFLHYQTPGPIEALAMNPDVTVRARGVMEKCTYCVQRISGARITAKKENRPVRDGEVVTACQQTCPTGAITFGNLNDPAAAVTKAQARSDAYGVLSDLMTRPRTLYLPKRVNPAPKAQA